MSGELTPLEEDLLAALDPGEIAAHRAALVAALPAADDGAAGRDRTASVIRSKLRSWDIPVVVHRFDALVSLPGEAHLSLARRRAPVRALVLPFSPATPTGGIVAELRATTPETAAGDTLTGAIALIDGPASAATVARIAAHGALAQVYISPDEALEPVAVPNAWGGAAATPAIAIGRATGEGFLALCAAGATPVRLTVATDWATRRLLLPVATIRGVEEPEDFVLLGAPGPTAADGGEAAACLLELCRVLAAHAGRLRRGIRCAWWPGGAAPSAGPLWYTDQTWGELGRHATCYVDLPPTERRRAQSLQGWGEAGLQSFAETALREGGVRALTWASAPDPALIGPFARLGLPTLRLAAGQAGAIGACVPVVARLCTAPLLPLDLLATARAIEARIQAATALIGERLDYAPLGARGDGFREAAERMHLGLLHIAQAASPNYEEGVEIGNRALRRLSRLLLPVLRHPGDPYAATTARYPDLAPLPGLDVAVAFAALQGGAATDEREALRAAAIRERNRVLDALSGGIAVIDEALASLRPLGFG